MIERERLEAGTYELAEVIRRNLPPGVGFMLMLFSLRPGFTAYASNANREDMVRELRDLADRLERGTDG